MKLMNIHSAFHMQLSREKIISLMNKKQHMHSGKPADKQKDIEELNRDTVGVGHATAEEGFGLGTSGGFRLDEDVYDGWRPACGS